MNNDEKRFISNEITGLQKELHLFIKNVEKQWEIREEHYSERKKETDKRLDEIHDSVKLLFDKNENVKDAVQDAVKDIKTRPCNVHENKFINHQKDINRLFGWLTAICVWLLTITGALLKKIFN